MWNYIKNNLGNAALLAFFISMLIYALSYVLLIYGFLLYGFVLSVYLLIKEAYLFIIELKAIYIAIAIAVITVLFSYRKWIFDPQKPILLLLTFINDHLIVIIDHVMPFLTFVGLVTVSFYALFLLKAPFALYILTLFGLGTVGVGWYLLNSDKLIPKGIYNMIFKAHLTIRKAEYLRERFIDADKERRSYNGDLYLVNKKLHDKFHYEFVPLIKLAKYKGASHLSLIEDDSERCDGVLHFNAKEDIKVEFTTAIDHEGNNLRIEHLARYGDAPVYDKVNSSGTKHNRTMPRNPITVHKETDLKSRLEKDLTARINDAVKKKISMQNNSDALYKDFILGILYEGYGLDHKDLLSIVDKIKLYLSDLHNDFREVYLISNTDLVNKVYNREDKGV